MSVSGVHANAAVNNLPSQRSAKPVALQALDAAAAQSAQPLAQRVALAPSVSSSIIALAPAGAIRTDPRMIRVWILPYEDSDGDLHDQSYLYLPVDSGRWLVENTRRKTLQVFAPLRAPRSASLPSQGAERVSAPQDGSTIDPSTLPAAIRAAVQQTAPNTPASQPN
jgi:conjugal transfer pilus assembly protein TraV